jgi:hypothetical protein
MYKGWRSSVVVKKSIVWTLVFVEMLTKLSLLLPPLLSAQLCMCLELPLV